MDMIITFPGGKRADARYRGFRIETDQPVYNGGEGSAPEPFTLFLASFGTCAGVYVLSFCEKRNIPTEGLTLIQRMERNKEARMIEKISIEIQVPPEFPEKYKNAVIKAAKQCAVERHLHNPPVIEYFTTVQPKGS
jgi:ribosomal protein S12 methylthiotransferase accessory factor